MRAVVLPGPVKLNGLGHEVQSPSGMPWPTWTPYFWLLAWKKYTLSSMSGSKAAMRKVAKLKSYSDGSFLAV
eukprot:scaffold82799_cov46-Prasinocladus_malaysianus.AAC.2